MQSFDKSHRLYYLCWLELKASVSRYRSTVVCNISSAGPSQLKKYKFQGNPRPYNSANFTPSIFTQSTALSIFNTSSCAKMAVNWIAVRRKTKFPAVNSYTSKDCYQQRVGGTTFFWTRSNFFKSIQLKMSLWLFTCAGVWNFPSRSMPYKHVPSYDSQSTLLDLILIRPFMLNIPETLDQNTILREPHLSLFQEINKCNEFDGAKHPRAIVLVRRQRADYSCGNKCYLNPAE